MKKLFKVCLEGLTGKAIQELTTVVEERLATGFEQPAAATTSFGAADLWNIQRSRRTFVQRRYIL